MKYLKDCVIGSTIEELIAIRIQTKMVNYEFMICQELKKDENLKQLFAYFQNNEKMEDSLLFLKEFLELLIGQQDKDTAKKFI